MPGLVTPYEVTSLIIPILHMKKLRHKEVTYLFPLVMQRIMAEIGFEYRPYGSREHVIKATLFCLLKTANKNTNPTDLAIIQG